MAPSRLLVSVLLLGGLLLPQEAELDGFRLLVEAARLLGDAGLGGPIWLDPEGNPLPFVTDAEVVDFLATARVIDRREIGHGITNPEQLLLERDGTRAHAVFHDVNVHKTRQQLDGQLVMFFRDSYTNNVAAYELSRLLGITNVPPAVVRKVGSNKGSVQMWLEQAIEEVERRQRGINPPGTWRLAGADMWVFDNLINNIDRTQENFVYDSQWNLWYIDHTRAFGRGRRLPSPERVKRCSRRLWQALRELDEAEVRRVLQPYLGTYEIAGVLHRHQRLLTLIEERIAQRGEERVLFSYRDPRPPVVVQTENVDIPAPPP